MGRFLAGIGSALLLVTAGFFIWRAQADKVAVIGPAPAVSAVEPVADLAPPLEATERTREQKRFSRYDHDKNGAVSRGEYLTSRQKAFAKLDTNGDGHLSFDEYAIKTETKFGAADHDRNGALNTTEFASTRVVRKSHPKPKCPARTPEAPAEEDAG